MIIDCHTHLGKLDGKEWIPEQLISSMDEAGIDYSLVITLEASSAKSQLTIEEIIEICDKSPRLKAIGKLDFDEVSKDKVEKLKTYLNDGKIFAVKFYLGYQKFYPADPKLSEIYQFCQENGYPVMFHTGMLEAGFPGQLKYSHPLNIDDLADKYPDLKIVIAHMGNPWIMDCAAVVAKNKNVYMDFSGYFLDFTSIRQEEIEMFLRLLKDFKTFAGFDKCLFGTDWPLYSQKEYLNATMQLSLTDEERELVLWKNASQVFNIKV